MAYCTYDDLLNICPERVIVQLTDDARTGVADQLKVLDAIEAEADIIDAHIGKIIKLPIAGDIPPILKRLNGQMAVHHLYIRIKTPPDHWVKQYENCIKVLGKIRDNVISIGVQPMPESPEIDNVRITAVSNTRTSMFSSEEMEKY